MKAQDLRIGNWFYRVNHDDDKIPTQVTVKILQDFVNSENPDDYEEARYHVHPEPIPLTPEILEECFVGKDHIEISHACFITQEHGTIYLQTEYHVLEKIHQTELPVKYLHELQNAVWCLSGKELTINL